MQYISPESMRYSALSASEAEQALELANGDRHYWSLRLLENVENYYYSIGNYRKSMETAEKLKSIFPMYVIPLRIIAMSYFYGDLKRTKNLVEEALSFAINNNLFNDTHMLYSVKALMESFYGNEETALMYSDRAYGALTDDIGFERYFTVYVRCYLNCLFNRVSYAANLANLYLHEAQELAPKYSAMMLQIYSYAALKEGNRSRSYRAATQAIDAAENRSFVWLYSMGLATNCLLAKGEIRDVRSIVTNILRCGENYGMLMVLTDTAVFGPILREAEAGEIEPETVSKIKALIDAKQGGKGEQGVLHVTMFGDSAVSMNGKELQWKTRKSKDLFLHYMLAGEFGIDRNVIIDYMWKDYLYDSAINNLKTTNNIIRKTLAQYGVKFKLVVDKRRIYAACGKTRKKASRSPIFRSRTDADEKTARIRSSERVMLKSRRHDHHAFFVKRRSMFGKQFHGLSTCEKQLKIRMRVQHFIVFAAIFAVAVSFVENDLRFCAVLRRNKLPFHVFHNAIVAFPVNHVNKIYNLLLIYPKNIQNGHLYATLARFAY